MRCEREDTGRGGRLLGRSAHASCRAPAARGAVLASASRCRRPVPPLHAGASPCTHNPAHNASQMERRDRLRELLAHMGEEAAVAALGPVTEEEMAEAEAATLPPATEVFYTEGSPALLAARREIAQHSLRRAALRLAAARRARESPDEDEAAEAAAAERQLRTVGNQASEIGDERPIAGCAFSPDGSQLATGAWSGVVKVWAASTLAKQLTIKAHAERVTGVAWHPDASSTGGRAAPSAAVAAGLPCMLPWRAGKRSLAAAWQAHRASVSLLLAPPPRLRQGAWSLPSRSPRAPPTRRPSCGAARGACCAR